MTDDESGGVGDVPAGDGALRPALTARERAAFEQDLEDAELREVPEARVRAKDALSRSYAEISQDEFDDVMDNLSFAGQRVLWLKELLADAPTIDGPNPGVARLHSRVRVRSDDGTESSYRIVFPTESQVGLHPEVMDVTWRSGVAQALIGRRAGDRSVIKAPIGETRITILEVVHQSS